MQSQKNKFLLSTETIDLRKMEQSGENIYSIINILGKRATQVNSILKADFLKKLEEINTFTDSLEEVFENKEQIELSKSYEALPKSTLIAIQEFLDQEILFQKPKHEVSIKH